MPGGDRTGPAGMGPMTGRAAGYCAGYSMPGAMNPVPGRGFWGRGRGGGRGGGRGWRHRFYATGLTGWQRAAWGWPAFPMNWPQAAWPAGQFAAPPAAEEQEIDLLKRQAEAVANVLDDIKKRLEELQAQPQQE